MKADPSRIALESLLAAADRLSFVRELDLPHGLLANAHRFPHHQPGKGCSDERDRRIDHGDMRDCRVPERRDKEDHAHGRHDCEKPAGPIHVPNAVPRTPAFHGEHHRGDADCAEDAAPGEHRPAIQWNEPGEEARRAPGNGRRRDQHQAKPIFGGARYWVASLLDCSAFFFQSPVVFHQRFGFLRRIGRQFDISPVLIEEVAVYDFINQTAEMATRFDLHALPRWEYGEEFFALLDSLEAALPLARVSDLSDEPMARMIFQLSEGLIGEIVAIISVATAAAVRSGAERITKSGIAELHYVVACDQFANG